MTRLELVTFGVWIFLTMAFFLTAMVLPEGWIRNVIVYPLAVLAFVACVVAINVPRYEIMKKHLEREKTEREHQRK